MKIKINGNEYLGGLSNWKISEKIGNPTSSTINIEVQAGDVPPQAGDVIQILEDDDTPIFFGLIGIPKTPKYTSFFQPKIYNLNCSNGNSVLSRRIANYSFANKTITEIVQTLYDTYIASEGITLGTISQIDTPVFEIYNCKNMNLLSVLNELAGYINGAWQITDDKVFNFVKIDDFPRCSQVIDKDNASITNLQMSDSDRDLRTNQIIDGAYLTTDLQTEYATVTDNWQGFFTAFAVVSQPRIWVNNVEVPQNEIGVKGIQEHDTTILFYWSYNSRQISINRDYEGSIVLNEGDEIKIEYIGLAPIRYVIQNPEKVAEIKNRTGLSGIIDNVYNDPTIVTKADAVTKAEGLLNLYGNQQRTIKFEVSRQYALEKGFVDSDFNLYTQWSFNLTEIGLVGDFVLTEKSVVPHVLNDDDSLYYSLTFTDRNFIQSYGEVITNLYHDFIKLSVRAEETVIMEYVLEETTRFEEQLDVDTALVLYVAQSMYNGQIALPLGTIMPNICQYGSDLWKYWSKSPVNWVGASDVQPFGGGVISGFDYVC